MYYVPIHSQKKINQNHITIKIFYNFFARQLKQYIMYAIILLPFIVYSHFRNDIVKSTLKSLIQIDGLLWFYK